jgi:predicted peroxiredoxin
MNFIHMKKILLILCLIILNSHWGFGQNVFSSCENTRTFGKGRKPNLGIIISSPESETVWNAVRLGFVAETSGDSVVIFVISKAVDVFIKGGDQQYNLRDICGKFIKNGGDIYTCATCVKNRNKENVEMCTITSIFDLYEIINNCKKIVSF